MNNTPTTEERIWAVLSHLSALALGMGIPLPIIGWSDQRRKSNYASFQCLQALGYQSLGYTIWVVLSALVTIFLVILMLVALGQEEGMGRDPNANVGIWIAAIGAVISGLLGIYLLPPVIATISCALGNDFRYPIIGARLARYLAYDPQPNLDVQRWLNENNEFRWVASMGHFSILILLWGMLVPFAAWILQGGRSGFLKIQSVQALIYQAVTTSFYFVVLLLYGVGIFSLIAIMGFMTQSSSASAIDMLGILLLGVSLLLALASALLVPLLHILGQWAGYRVLMGEDYRYPLVGALVDRSISKPRSFEIKENLE